VAIQLSRRTRLFSPPPTGRDLLSRGVASNIMTRSDAGPGGLHSLVDRGVSSSTVEPSFRSDIGLVRNSPGRRPVGLATPPPAGPAPPLELESCLPRRSSDDDTRSWADADRSA